MNLKSLIILATGLLILIFVTIFYIPTRKRVSAPQPPETRLYNLKEYSDSGQTGMATLTESEGKLKVILEVAGYETREAQPAHIHSGNCPNIGPVVHSLTDVVNGISETELDTTFEALFAQNEELSVNIHKSYSDFKTYTSCGDLK